MSISFSGLALPLLLLLNCAFCFISCASTVTSRRSLHQPFFPLDSIPPSQPPSVSPPSPPSPSSPNYPFSSSSNSTPTNSPIFFPTYPSPPPPPPSPVSYATLPANISSLIVPNSPSSTSSRMKLFPLAIAAIVASVFISAMSLILFIRHRRRSSGFSEKAESKTFSSANNGGPPTTETNTVSVKQRATASSTSSEFLYLGTIVNSRGIDDRGGSGEGIDPRKLDSPDLQPLPPLARLGNRHNHEPPSSAAEETEEEFYSPRAESGSRRAFACFGSNLEGSGPRRSHSSSTGSSSCSSDSPSRSQSISLSPAVSLSPQRSHSKSPEHISDTAKSEAHYATIDESKTPLLSSSQLTSPDRDSDKNLSRSFSAVYGRNPQSPSLSPLSWSPGRAFERNPDVSLRLWHIPNSNPQSLSSSLISSPSPGRRSNSSNRIKDSLLMSALGRSLERAVEAEEDQSDHFSLPSGSPLKVSESGSIAPPPPPPPPPFPQRLQENPTPLAPISRPPSLIPPSQPFMLQNIQKNLPFGSELPPPSSEPIEVLEDSTLKPKLKPLHWDKVRATSDREMVWDHLRSSSFKLNEEMIETLFVAPNSRTKETMPRSVLPYPNQENRVLDSKKSQNIAILLRALNVTIEEVIEALLEGNADTLGTELLESLLKMAPTKEEERKLKDYRDDSPIKLGPAEKFLKSMLEMPYAFKRIEAMLYIANFDSEVDYLKKSFETLEAACEELRNSRMFMKLLEAVLKTGNRMNVGTNRGDALSFKLETLLKLVDVKGADGRTTLLHFVVQEMIKSEGARLSETNPNPSEDDAKCRKLGLQVVSGLTSELTHVKKAAAMDSEVLSSDVKKLSLGIKTIEETVRSIESTGLNECSSKFSDSMTRFVKISEDEILKIQAREKVAMFLVKEITEYFHGDSAKEEAHPFRMFLIVRDFLTVLDRVCKEIGSVNERTLIGSAHRFPVPVNPLLPDPVNRMLPQVLPSFNAKKRYGGSSDDESSSP